MMRSEHEGRGQEIICECSGTTVAGVERVFARGIRDLEGVSRATGACSGCGGCDYEVERVLAQLVLAAAEGDGEDGLPPAGVRPPKQTH